MSKWLWGAVLLAVSLSCGAEAPDGFGPVPDFYAKYPQLLKVFPFGVYGAPEHIGYCSENIYHMGDDRAYQFSMEGLRENYLNFYWHLFHRNFTVQPDGSYAMTGGQRELEWLRRLDMYVTPSMAAWFNVNGHWPELTVFKNYRKLGDQSIPAAELDAIIAANRPKFAALQTLRDTYGDRILAIVNDDEPGGTSLANASSMAAIKRFLPDIPATVVHNGGPAFLKAVPQLELVCGEAYNKERAWETRNEFLTAYAKSPETVCWNDINAGSYGVEYTLPWLPDDRFDAPLIRLLYWQSLAGGAKGFICYSERLRPSWWEGEEPHIRNPLGRELKGGALGAIRDVGREMTAVGPLLLTCQPAADAIAEVSLAGATVDHFPYCGPALDCGVLVDRGDAALRYIVVYNNDLAAEQAGRMTLPAAWLAGRQLFDLHALEAVPAADGAFAIAPLPPGDGRVYVVADDATFARCRDTVLRYRVGNELVRLQIRLRDLDPFARGPYAWACAWYLKDMPDRYTALDAKATDLIARIGAGQTPPAELYADVLALIGEADVIKGTGMMAGIDLKFQQLADQIAALDEMIACFGPELFGLTGRLTSYASGHLRRNRELMADYVNLTDRYWACRNIWWRGVLSPDLDYRLDTALAAGKALQTRYQGVVDEALAKQRRPIRVLFVTPREREDEYYLTYAWLYKNFPADYGLLTPAGTLETWGGKPVDPAGYDVVWLHRLRPATPGDLGDPATVFEPGLLDKAFLDATRQRVAGGQGLLLTGLFAMYAVPLGYESVMPDVVQAYGAPRQSLLRGFCAAAGYAAHPLFGGDLETATPVDVDNFAAQVDTHTYGPRGVGTELRFAPAGFYTSGHRPDWDPYVECTWKAQRPTGQVVANVYDSTLGQLDGYAGIVEYGAGKGKVVVAGSMPFDLSPGQSHYPLFSLRWRCFVRGLAGNIVRYLAADGVFVPAPVADEGGKPRDQRFPLPKVWRFALDPDNQGMAKGWTAGNFDDSGWKEIEVGSTWESQGYDYDGYGWYRVVFSVPPALAGKHIFLWFGAVDEVGQVYLDGEHLGQVGAPPQEEPQGWATPGEFDITGRVTPGDTQYHLSVQVRDTLAAGGIWKPVVLIGRE